jgi:DTW domain-containing protein YfiP
MTNMAWLPVARPSCVVCRRPAVACYCPLLKPFESYPRFVILSHPREAKHRLGTGRMAHICISNSMLIEGVDFSENKKVEAIIHNRDFFAVILYPGDSSTKLSELSIDQRRALIPPGRKLIVVVPDGTWRTARKMIRLSRNLSSLPSLSFTPSSPSSYRIRRQPRPNLYCTLEAVHQVIDLFAEPENRKIAIQKPHDNLLEVFAFAVNQQLHYTP